MKDLILKIVGDLNKSFQENDDLVVDFDTQEQEQIESVKFFLDVISKLSENTDAVVIEQYLDELKEKFIKLNDEMMNGNPNMNNPNMGNPNMMKDLLDELKEILEKLTKILSGENAADTTEEPETKPEDMTIESFVEKFGYDEFVEVLSNIFILHNTIKDNDLKVNIESLLINDNVKDENIDLPEDLDDENTKTKDEAMKEIEIVEPKDEVSTKPQGKVDKIELRNKIKQFLDDGVPNAKDVLYETYGLVKCEDKMTCWEFPHHELIGNRLVLNVNGLRFASMYLLGARGGGAALKKEEKVEIAKHLLRHYKELDREPPAGLKKIAGNKEAKAIMVKTTDRLFEEVANLFDVDTEVSITYISLIESLLNDLYINEIINVESSDDENVLLLNLEGKQIEQIVKLFDEFTTNFTDILNGTYEEKQVSNDLDDAVLEEYKSEKAKLEEMVLSLKEKLEDITKELEIIKSEKTKLENIVSESSLSDKKLQVLVNMVTKGVAIDKSFVESLIDINDENELNMFTKVTEKFVISKNIKLTGNDEGITQDDIETIKTITSKKDNIVKESDKKEGVNIEKINILTQMI